MGEFTPVKPTPLNVQIFSHSVKIRNRIGIAYQMALVVTEVSHAPI